MFWRPCVCLCDDRVFARVRTLCLRENRVFACVRTTCLPVDDYVFARKMIVLAYVITACLLVMTVYFLLSIVCLCD